MSRPVDPHEADPLECFEDYYRREYRLLLKVVLAAGGTLEEAQDAVNCTMEELMSRWSDIAHPSAYARRAAINNFKKKRARERKGIWKAIAGGHIAPDRDECPDLLTWEDKQWRDQLVSSLPPAQREVAKAVFEGLTVEQISAQFGCTPEAIRQRLKRATKKLAELRKEGIQGFDGGGIR